MVRALIILSLLLLSVSACRDKHPVARANAKRVALLIGEGAYAPAPTPYDYSWPQLANPPHDVTLVAQKLREDGFDTTVLVNVKRADLETAITDFAAKAAKADDAVVYYAGHGFEYARHNYMVPIDAPTTADTNHLGETYVDVDEVARAAGQAHKVNIFFMDACRTRQSLVKLAAPTKPYVDDVEFKPGTPVAVVYSTARGEEAFDHGDGPKPPHQYSPFAWFVAQYLTLPRTSLGDFFTFVNAKVQQSTRNWGPQSPYMLSSLTKVYYFRPAGALLPKLPPEADGGPASGGGQARGLSTSLNLPLQYLAVTDEPVVVADVLADHTVDDIVSMAQGGDPMAAYLLGYMFEYGRGAQQDYAQARNWLTRAAASGLAPTQLELGYFLVHHGSAAGDAARGRALMEAAAAKGFAKAQAHLADVLMNDRVKADYWRGVDLYRRAGAQNYPQALWALATLKMGDTRPALSALAARGDMASRQWLCDLAAREGTVAGALSDCLASAKAGYAISQAHLAIAYHDGAGVAADPDEARHWTRVALIQPDLWDDLRLKIEGFGY